MSRAALSSTFHARNCLFLGLFFVFFAASVSFFPIPARAALSSTPQANFPKPNGEVDAMALAADGTLFIGGDFTSIDGQARNHVAAINSSGTLTSWNPNANGTVFSILISGSTIYLGGDFTTVGGSTRNHIAAVDAAGAVQSWNPNANDTVSALVLSGGTLYVGGDFTTIGGQSRKFAAALSASTGTATSWNPNPDDSVFAMALDGSTIYLGGFFTSVASTPRNRLAAVDTSGTLSSWNPSANSFIAALTVANGTVFIGGDFTTIGGSARNHLAAVNSQGTVTSWAPDVNDLVAAIAVSDSVVYFSGDFTSVNSQTRKYLAAVDTSGTLSSWNPNAGNSVAAIAVSSTKLYAGGLFTTIGGQAIPYLAAYSTGSGTVDGDITAPQATITSPVNGATLTGQTTVSATATDNIAVTQVELYVNGTKLATDTSSPYSFAFSPDITVPATYSLVAKAYDAASNIGSSAAVSVKVGNGGTGSGGTTPSTPSGQVATPGITPNGGSFTAPISVYLTDATAGASIRYTLDGTSPTTSSPLYNNSLSLLLAQSTTLKTTAFKDGMTPSTMVTASFTIAGGTNPNPMPGPGTGSVNLPPGTAAGDVVKFGSAPAIYLIQDDGMHVFDTYSSYQGYIAAFHKTLKIINDSAINYTMGQGLAREVVNIPAAPGKSYATGALVNENGTIYVVIGSSAVPFTSMAAFTGLGYQTKYVVKGSLAGYSKATSFFLTSANQPHPYGAWLKVDATHYYYMHQSGMIRSPSSATFSSNGGQGKFILPANAADKAILSAYPDLAPLVSNDPRRY